MGQYFFFFVGLSLILTHEMDAVRSREWRIFPLLERINNDQTGYVVFTVAHIPLYLTIFWNLFGVNGINQTLVRGLNIFFIVHVFLHVLYLRHPKNQFTSAVSWIVILGAGVAGLIDLVINF
jgi:hypothetical protein